MASDRIKATFRRRVMFRRSAGTARLATSFVLHLQTVRLMPSFHTRRVVRHPPKAMFDLVADVERYPEFLPLCEALEIRSRESASDGVEVIMATMTAGYGLIRESFTSRVQLDHRACKILVSYIDGPFRTLENQWLFLPHPHGCEVDFFIEYEFRSRALQMLVGALFDGAVRRFSHAFEIRAHRVYGWPSAEVGAGPALRSGARPPVG
jgi:coenzyme Q-binding protein COQ10